MAGLTKQHFKEIAKIIANTQKDINGFIGQMSLINNLSNYFKTQNPLFNENQFKKACLE